MKTDFSQKKKKRKSERNETTYLNAEGKNCQD